MKSLKDIGKVYEKLGDDINSLEYISKARKMQSRIEALKENTS